MSWSNSLFQHPARKDGKNRPRPSRSLRLRWACDPQRRDRLQRRSWRYKERSWRKASTIIAFDHQAATTSVAVLLPEQRTTGVSLASDNIPTETEEAVRICFGVAKRFAQTSSATPPPV